MSRDAPGADLPELLAPAGTIEAGLTALDAGADAVYAGLPRFNARERGRNLTAEELSKLVAYAHKGGRRVYVTLNTLVKQKELDDLIPILVDLALLRPDAIIAQDLGVVRLLRERLPEIEIHASTQMGFHNSAGLAAAERLGIRRVILERQTTFEEIEAMGRRSSLELEVFVHGALCCSRSGVCLFSSWMGGWSGNRGKCKQPCRRRYHGDEGNGFFFSPCDLSALDDVGRLAAMGVAGLKIEGRLRKPDYVRRVVTAYRMVLDSLDRLDEKVVREARSELAEALGRRWRRPFRDADDFSDVVRHDVMGGSGRLSGKVTRRRKGGIEIAVSRPIRRYDTLRVQPRSGDEGPSFTVTSLKVGSSRAKVARKGQSCFVPTDADAGPGDLVYKTGSATEDLSERVARLPVAPAAVDLAAALGDGALRVSLPLLGLEWSAPAPLVPAERRPLTSARLAAELRRSRSTSVAAGRIEVAVEEGVFLPLSSLKELRRAFWRWAEERIAAADLRRRWQERLAPAPRPERGSEGGGELPPTETVVLLRRREPSPIAGAIVARELLRPNAHAAEVVLPDFCAEADLGRFRDKVEEAHRSGIRRFRVTSLFGFSLLDGLDDVVVTTSFPLPACNSLAVEELRGLGALTVGAWVELEGDALRELLEAAPGPIEVYAYGRLPILATRMAIPAKGRVKDGRGNGFTLEQRGGQTRLFPDKVLSIPTPDGASRFVDLSHADWGEGDASTFNLDRELA